MEYPHYLYMPYGYYAGTTGPPPLHTNTCVPVFVASGRDASLTVCNIADPNSGEFLK